MQKIKVLVIDDSPVFCKIIEASLAQEKDIQVVGTVHSGSQALDWVLSNPPDLVTLDVEMPGENGLEILKKIQALNQLDKGHPPIGVIMVSAFTRKGA